MVTRFSAAKTVNCCVSQGIKVLKAFGFPSDCSASCRQVELNVELNWRSAHQVPTHHQAKLKSQGPHNFHTTEYEAINPALTLPMLRLWAERVGHNLLGAK